MYNFFFLGILLNCANSQNIEMCAMATAKLHSLLQTRSIKDMEEGGYMLYMVNKGITSTLQGNSFSIIKLNHN